MGVQRRQVRAVEVLFDDGTTERWAVERWATDDKRELAEGVHGTDAIYYRADDNDDRTPNRKTRRRWTDHIIWWEGPARVTYEQENAADTQAAATRPQVP